jgi:redox-sensitive bicupin YhaK (pirin superfamily)
MPETSTLTVRRSDERGHAKHGWLDSRHTFSFADYYDPDHMGFRSLRVINEDHVAPGMGFPSHPHRDMEIFSYVLGGALQHKDSLGNGRVLHPGEIQLMSAGTGVVHSEFNPSPNAPAHFLQIWIIPSAQSLMPSYTEWRPNVENEHAAKVLLISRDGREGSATIHQDVDVWRVRLDSGETSRHTIRDGRAAWLQTTRGRVDLNATTLEAGDGASSETPGIWQLKAEAPSEALLFDLA